jgi:hypothetical protein
MATQVNTRTAMWIVLGVLLGFLSRAEALTVIGPADTLNLNGTLPDDVLNQGTLNVQWVNNPGGSFSLITGALENPGLTRIIAIDPAGGFFSFSPLGVNGGIQNTGTIRLETAGSFGNSGAFASLGVDLGTTLTNLPGGLIETTVHTGPGQSGNTIGGQILNQGMLNHNAFTTLNIVNSTGDLVGADHVNAGTISINGGAASVSEFHSFNNSGTLQGRSITLSGFPNGIQPGFTATITNSGLIDMTAGSIVAVSLDSFTSTPTGQINLTGGNGSFSHFNSWVNQGTITIDAGWGLGLNGGVNAGVAENQSGGVIAGNGTLTIVGGTTFTNNGTISPGLSFGTLSVAGGVTNGSNSILDIEVGGLLAGTNHDQIIQTSGSMTLGGTLRLNFQGFAPSALDSFTFIDGSVFGTFDQVEILGIEPDAQFSVDTSNGFVLTALNDWTLIPEPGTLILLALGGVSLVGRSRSRGRL